MLCSSALCSCCMRRVLRACCIFWISVVQRGRSRHRFNVAFRTAAATPSFHDRKRNFEGPVILYFELVWTQNANAWCFVVLTLQNELRDDKNESTNESSRGYNSVNGTAVNDATNPAQHFSV